MRRGLALIALIILIFAIQSVQADGSWSVDLLSDNNGVVGSVDFEIVGDTLNATYTVTADGWCLTATSLYAGNVPPAGLSPSEFTYQHALTCDLTDSFSVTAPEGDVFVSAHADIQFLQSLPHTEAPLSDEGTMLLQTGTDSYFNATVDILGLASQYEAWCVDLEHLISTGVTYDVQVFEDGASLVDRSENLDLVLYVINQDYSSIGATAYDVQLAIWTLIDDIIPGGTPASAAIVEDAIANGEGFQPGCGQLTGVFLDDSPETQNIMITIPAPCEPEIITDSAWASAEWGSEFGDTGGVYFQLVDAPDATPDVTQNPDQTREPSSTQEPWSTQEPTTYRDTDGDGFYDHVDSCPGRGNEGGLGVDETGCPYYDADWDGVYDRNDSCPWQGSEGGLGIDETGCPYYDADGDGVYDRNDSCPWRSNEYGYGVGADGCPLEGEPAPPQPEVTPEPEVTAEAQ